MARIDVKQEGYNALQQAEDDACERTLKRLAEHAEVMGVTVEQALNDVIPDTRARLERYMKRKASPQPAGFKRLGE